ncbi:MAG: hypothetical protein KAQ68_05545 [Clostridiales bacterium]|nr:hypothetical protein [Clostridiales bacterium]
MNLTHYAFAFFVFILVCILVILIKRMGNTNKKAEKAYGEQEKRLFKLYQNLEDMISGTEEYIEEFRSEIIEDRKNIAMMLKKIDTISQDMYNVSKPDSAKVNTTTKSTKSKKPKDTKEDEKPEIILSKNQRVKLLKEQGADIAQISKELGISQGEVALIIGLNR